VNRSNDIKRQDCLVRRQLATVMRGGGLLVAATCIGTAACRLAVPPVTTLAGTLLQDGAGGLEALAFEDALTVLCAAVLLGCVLWLILIATLTVTAHVARELVPGSRWARTLGRAVDRSCPATVGRLVAGALGLAVTVGVAGPAPAEPMPAHPGPDGTDRTHATQAPTASIGPDRLNGLALPDRIAGALGTAHGPATSPRPSPRPSPATDSASHTDSTVPPRPAGSDVVVRPGQSLWTIAARLLPTAATDADITRAWHQLHRANQSAIGADPDLILPGTRLVVPRPTARPTREEAP
jgi:hypothetical protein